MYRYLFLLPLLFVFPLTVGATTALVDGKTIATSTNASFVLSSDCFNGSSCSYVVFSPDGLEWSQADGINVSTSIGVSVGMYGSYVAVVGPNTGNFTTNCQSSDNLNSCTTWMMVNAQANGAVASYSYMETFTAPTSTQATSTITYTSNPNMEVLGGILLFMGGLFFSVWFFRKKA